MTSILKLSHSLAKLPKNNNVIKHCKNLRQASTATQAKTSVNVPPTKVTTLANGIRVATEEWGSQTATVGIWIDAGSRYENSKNNGAGNFVEHLAFKGTGKRTQNQLEGEIEELGAELNAHTGREQTVYYAKSLAKDVPKTLEILGDIVQNAKLGDSEIEKERSTILKNLEEGESNFKDIVFDYLHATAYQGTPLANTVIGPTANIQCLKANDLKNYVDSSYKGSRIVVAGAGGISHEELVKLAESNLGKLNNTYPGEIPVLDHCRYTGSEIRVRDDSLPLAYVAIAVEGTGSTDPDNLTLSLVSTLVGAWDRSQGSSKQNANALARAGAGDLCHSYESFNINYRDTGLWGVYFVSDPLTLEDMVFNIQQEFMRLCTSVTEGEVERAKALLTTNTLLQLNTSSDVSGDIGRQLLNQGRRIPVQELIQRINGITAQNVRDVCYKYLYDRCPAVAAVGPVEQLPDYNRVRSSMYWLRV